MPTPPTVHVLLPLPFDHGFDYLIGTRGEGQGARKETATTAHIFSHNEEPYSTPLAPGTYVRVPFGKKELTGIVWGPGRGDVVPEKLKPILAVDMQTPPLSDLFRTWLEFIARYSMSPLGAVLKLVPLEGARGEGRGESEKSAKKSTIKLSVVEDVSSSFAPRPSPLAPQQAAAAQTLAAKLGAGHSVTVIDGVTGSGKTEVYFDTIERVLAGTERGQQTARASGPQSGAPLHMQEACAGRNQQVLVLLPEISLSVQWLTRFRARFGHDPIVWHSNITPAQKKKALARILAGENCVAVGARSALFLPFPNLKLIVVDEEHEPSYKQEEGVMYHARDMAVARAHHENIPIILVSATPSLETMVNVETGKYTALHLSHRHGGASMPQVATLDMRAEPLPAGQFISPSLRTALAETLAAGQQSLLFLNRRGYAPLLLCKSCGHRAACPDCSGWMVVHKKGIRGQGSGASFQHSKEKNLTKSSDHRDSAHLSSLPPAPRPLNPTLQCHHCGHQEPQPLLCPACGAEDSMHAFGPGIDRLAEEVADFLPAARVAILSSDRAEIVGEPDASHQGTLRVKEETNSSSLLTAKQHSSPPREARVSPLASLLTAIEAREIDLIIGTQMLAKGHHFPGLALVGVVDADMGLAGGDLRAGERTYQLLHQLSGRAGRAETPGRVLLQTYQPEHPVIQALAAGDRDAFLAREREWREAAQMPPYGRLAAVIVEGAEEAEVVRYARALGAAGAKEETRALREGTLRVKEEKIPSSLLAAQRPSPSSAHSAPPLLLGPAPAPLYRLRGKYRLRFLIQAPRGFPLQHWLRGWLSSCLPPRNIKVKMDIDPQSFM